MGEGKSESDESSSGSKIAVLRKKDKRDGGVHFSSIGNSPKVRIQQDNGQEYYHGYEQQQQQQRPEGDSEDEDEENPQPKTDIIPDSDKTAVENTRQEEPRQEERDHHNHHRPIRRKISDEELDKNYGTVDGLFLELGEIQQHQHQRPPPNQLVKVATESWVAPEILRMKPLGIAGIAPRDAAEITKRALASAMKYLEEEIEGNRIDMYIESGNDIQAWRDVFYSN